jgi:hypothetical protein
MLNGIYTLNVPSKNKEVVKNSASRILIRRISNYIIFIFVWIAFLFFIVQRRNLINGFGGKETNPSRVPKSGRREVARQYE